jgi:hypothetical protein
MVYKYLLEIVDLDEGTKDRVPSGSRGLQRGQRPRKQTNGTRHLNPLMFDFV